MVPFPRVEAVVMGPLTRALHVDYVEGLQDLLRGYLNRCQGVVDPLITPCQGVAEGLEEV
jgi:hypothetical protein